MSFRKKEKGLSITFIYIVIGYANSEGFEATKSHVY